MQSVSAMGVITSSARHGFLFRLSVQAEQG
jgi:hypothetical protein